MAEGQQSELEKLAIDAREKLIVKNIYNGEDMANSYTSTHTRAISDSQTPIQGKGTGIFLDTYHGGGDLDIYGNPNYAGSGRLPSLSSNGYNKDAPYVMPNTSGNQGQVPI